jgi:hypothetical protein
MPGVSLNHTTTGSGGHVGAAHGVGVGTNRPRLAARRGETKQECKTDQPILHRLCGKPRWLPFLPPATMVRFVFIILFPLFSTTDGPDG